MHAFIHSFNILSKPFLCEDSKIQAVAQLYFRREMHFFWLFIYSSNNYLPHLPVLGPGDKAISKIVRALMELTF